jgi:hypothetical protein
MPHMVRQVKHDAASATRCRIDKNLVQSPTGDFPQTGHTEPVRGSVVGYAISSITLSDRGDQGERAPTAAATPARQLPEAGSQTWISRAGPS